MSDEIVERARATQFDSVAMHILCGELADEIERLREDKAQISRTASGYLHEIERLTAAVDRECAAKEEYMEEIERLQNEIDDWNMEMKEERVSDG